VDGLAVDMVDRVRDGGFEGDQATVETCRESIRFLLEISAEHGIRRVVPEASDTVFRDAIAAGYGQDDFSALINVMR
jgi:3-hydroxyisobutyrate dehydrogenase-like beta-hydroxyacid dehydrogenase